MPRGADWTPGIKASKPMEMEYERLHFDVLHTSYQTEIPLNRIDDMRGTTELHAYIDQKARMVVIQAEAFGASKVAGNVKEYVTHDFETTFETTFEYPATWWEHFKQTWFPTWLKKRFPVWTIKDTRRETRKDSKTSVVEYKQLVVYPNLPLPPEYKQGAFSICVREGQRLL